MKPYGLPRCLDIEYPDKLDITVYGLAPSRHGEKRKSKAKNKTRRYWKRTARALNKQIIQDELKDMIKLPFDTEPDFINDIGVKYWLDKSLTSYANRPDKYGTTLHGQIFFVEHPEFGRNRIYIEDQKIYAEETSLESIAQKIDLFKWDKRNNNG